MSYTRKQINAFRDSIRPGDRLVITERGWWRGDGGDPDMYQTVVEVRPSQIRTEAEKHKNNEGFTFSTPAWELDRCADWRKMMRKLILADRASDPRGWRVTFDALELEESA